MCILRTTNALQHPLPSLAITLRGREESFCPLLRRLNLLDHSLLINGTQVIRKSDEAQIGCIKTTLFDFTRTPYNSVFIHDLTKSLAKQKYFSFKGSDHLLDLSFSFLFIFQAPQKNQMPSVIISNSLHNLKLFTLRPPNLKFCCHFGSYQL